MDSECLLINDLGEMSSILSVQKNLGETVVSIETANMDSGNATKIKQEFKDVTIPEGGAVVVDLEQIEFIDSSGIGALLSFYKALASQQISLRLRNVGPTVMSVLELLRLHRVLEIES